MRSLMFFLLIFFGCDSIAFSNFLPPDLNKECLDFIAKLPAEVQYDFVRVPENWRHPLKGPWISIFYYGKNLNKMAQSRVTPIVYYNGGPGFSTHPAFTYFQTYPDAQGVPFLFIDQRGTGCSGAFPEVPATRAGAERSALYGTRSIVLDSEAIRFKLFKGHLKWNIFGQSFGTAIVHRYIAIAPFALKKAFAHGLSMMTNGTAWVEARLLAQKRVSASYLAQYPADEAIMRKARSQMPADYCSGNQTSVTCGAGLLETITERLGFSSRWKQVHELISGLLGADGNIDFKYLGEILPNHISEDSGMADFMAAAVATRELPGGLLENWSCKLAIPALLASAETPDTWFRNECRSAMATRATSDSFIETMIGEDYLSLEDLEHGLEQYPKLDLYLYSGELDTFSPREGCTEVVSRLGARAHYTNFLNSGHDWLYEKQIWNDFKKE